MNSKNWAVLALQILSFFVPSWRRKKDNRVKITHVENPFPEIPATKRDELLAQLRSWDGVTEVSGTKSNSRILAVIKAAFPEATDDGQVSWCGLFVGHVLASVGISNANYAVARDWLKFGEETTTPTYGDIVVLWRENRHSWKGHVGFYYGEQDGNIMIFGGNQSDSACVKSFPASRLLGYRNPF